MATFLGIMVVMAFLQVPRLIKIRDWRGLIAFAGVWLIATAYGGLFFAGVPLPRHAAILIRVFEGITK